MAEEWTPLGEPELYDLIHAAESRMYGELANFWQLIRINPVKWQESGYGNEGGGFWAVAVCGQQVVWYNDIEGGFNISRYDAWGHIDDYFCNQDLLDTCIRRLYDLVRYGGALSGHAGPPL